MKYSRAALQGRKARRKAGEAPVMSVWLLIVLSGWLTGVPCAVGPSPSVDNAVSYTSLLRLIKNRQIDVTSMVELYLTLTGTTHTHTGTCAVWDTHKTGKSIFMPLPAKKLQEMWSELIICLKCYISLQIIIMFMISWWQEIGIEML